MAYTDEQINIITNKIKWRKFINNKKCNICPYYLEKICDATELGYYNGEPLLHPCEYYVHSQQDKTLAEIREELQQKALNRAENKKSKIVEKTTSRRKS